MYFSCDAGDSKGYGLIKYVSSDAAAQARHLLDGRTVTCPKNPHASYSLDCDWLNSSHITFKSLHSKALFVNCLPPNYRDLGEFRRIFSLLKTPPYCQVGCSTDHFCMWLFCNERSPCYKFAILCLKEQKNSAAPGRRDLFHGQWQFMGLFDIFNIPVWQPLPLLSYFLSNISLSKRQTYCGIHSTRANPRGRNFL